MHVALARKYRPKQFADLIGQEHIARVLRGAVEQNRVAHGYLLCGPRGVGKTTAARILAMALNCETRHAGKSTGGEPCGTCASCARIWAGSASLDVIEIDAASNRGVDDARELRERAMYAASQEGRHKIYIVDEAHMLTREAWNTLLKVLEEPPPGVVFVFATTEPNKIGNTAAPVMSRLQRFDFRRVGPEAIGKRLADVAQREGLSIDADAVDVIARMADGGLRDALSVLDQVTAFGGGSITAARIREVLGMVGDDVYAELLDIVAQHRGGAVFPFVARLVEAGVDLIAFAEGAGDLLRAVLAVRLGAQPDGITAALEQAVRRQAGDLAPGDLLRMLRCLEESEEALRRGQSPRLTLEVILVRWALMDRTVDIAALLKSGASGSSGASGASGASADRAQRQVPVPAPAPAPVLRDSLPLGDVPTRSLGSDAVRSAWPRILDALRGDRKMIAAEMLAVTDVASVEGDVIVLTPQPGQEMAKATIERYRDAIAASAGKVLGVSVRIAVVGEDLPASRPVTQPAARPAPTPAPAPAPAAPTGDAPAFRPASQPAKAERLSASGAQAERAKALRGKDPALDSAMDAMDLELLD
ncbi:MAG TPA: DNA polymerase III subunit gamma/tau [Gemmatimonadales bacterium]